MSRVAGGEPELPGLHAACAADASRTELLPEAISDFQIVNHGYAAQSGGAGGGSIEIQTRSGSALQHGDAFIFVQNGALNVNPPLERVPYKPDENRLRAGLSTGGALGGKTFYYLAAEQEYARAEDANDISPATILQINQALKQVGPLHSLSLEGGFIPTIEQETESSARADCTVTSRESWMLRYALTYTDVKTVVAIKLTGKMQPRPPQSDGKPSLRGLPLECDYQMATCKAFAFPITLGKPNISWRIERKPLNR